MLFDLRASSALPDRQANPIISLTLRLAPRYSSRVGILKIRFLWSSAAAALTVAAALAGCGGTTYFAGRNLPPSKLTNRVLIAIQNPSAFGKGLLQFVDAYYDRRAGYGGKPASYSISGYAGALPVTIQNMPEEQVGYVYGSGDGSFTPASYSKETSSGAVGGLSGLSSSIFITRSQNFVFAASQSLHVFSVVDRTNSGTYTLSLPGVYRVSVNPGGTMALAFVQNSNYAYYPVKLSAAQTTSFSGGPPTWPKAAVDCEPQQGPGWCLYQMQSPDAIDSTGNYYGLPLKFDRPVKALYSADGSTAYILNCGPECGGVASSISQVPISPILYTQGLQSGLLPCNTAPCANSAAIAMKTILVPGGASNGLVNTSTMYLVGQKQNIISGQTYYGGNLSVLNLTTGAVTSTTPISDGQPGLMSRMIEADDNTLWIGMTGCTNGLRNATGLPQGCLTMYNTSTNTVTRILPYIGDATGIAAVTSLHKVYTAEGGQVYIYSTVDGTSLNNQFVTVTGTAWDVAYMDAITDANNTVY